MMRSRDDEAQMDELEARPVRAKIASQDSFMLLCGIVRRGEVHRHRMDVRGRTRDVVEERVLRHPVVALRVVSWQVALIAPEHMHVVPEDLRSKL